MMMERTDTKTWMVEDTSMMEGIMAFTSKNQILCTLFY